MSFLPGSGPRGPHPGFRTRVREPPLHVMVEQYLAENSNRSYINIEDMIDSLQPLFFRYSRMKRQTFGGMVRRAYHEYCQGKRGPRNSSGNVESTTANDDIAEGSGDEEEEGDSDVEIQQESYVPQQDVTNSRLNSLYTVAPANPKSASSSNTTGSPGTAGAGETGITSAHNGSKNECITSGESFVSLPKDAFSTTKLGGLTISLMKPKPNDEENWETNTPNATTGDDSDNDLEIIDEVPPTVVPGGVPNNNASQDCVPNARQVIEARASGISNVNDNVTRGPAHSSSAQRGTIRKINVESSTNNDLNPKKRMRKDISGNKNLVLNSGLKLSDFAGSEKVVEEICRLLMHLKHPEIYSTLGVTAPRGFLLHGPPGTGKTLLANAIAGELQLPMLKVTGTEFISGISGESESNIRELFNQATSLAPCIIFIDEIDSITPKRENASKEMERRVVAQLLSCVDDLMNHERGSQVLLIGATNRIEAIDTALRRAGRFDREICLGIPDEKSRAKILQVICKNLRLAPGFDMSLLARLTPGYVGADLQALVREAAVQAVNKALAGVDKTRGESGEPIINASQSTNTADVPAKNGELSVPLLQETETPAVKNDSNDTENKEVDSSSPDGNQVVSTSDPSPAENDSKVTTNEDAMEVDSSIVNSASLEEEQQTEVATMSDSNHLKEVEGDLNLPNSTQPIDVQVPRQTEQSFLRWIRDTAPLHQEELDQLYIFMDDFELALKNVQPSSKREGFATVPDTTWDDIGALKAIREELEVSILGPVKHSDAFETLGLNTPAGVLLCGPPGCGKTLLAKAVANEAGINFISVKGPELLNMYVGESERAVRQCFLRAKNSAPCVIFFDEIDALCPRRSDGPESGSGSRIVNQLLTEMDGMEGRVGVFIMAATNRPDIIDPAVLRPGRLDKILFVDLPTAEDRYEILKAVTKGGKKPCLDSDVDLKLIAASASCENYTGADLAALVREASIAAFKDLILMQNSVCANKDLKVSARHFETALLKTKPSVSRKDREKYAAMSELYSNVNFK